MLDQKDLDALRDGSFSLDCAEMTLSQRATAAPRVLRGPGRFHQDADGAVSFTLYVNGVDHPPSFVSPVGQTIPEDQYYSLAATDLVGRRWWAEQVKPNEHYSFPTMFSVARGRVSPLHGCQLVSRRQRIRYGLTGYVFARPRGPTLRFPSNTRSTSKHRRGRWTATAGTWDVAEFAVDGVDMHIHHDDDQFVASAVAAEPLPPQYESRLAEALRFVLADDLWWDVVLRHEPDRDQVTLYNRRRKGLEVTLPPPIAPQYTQSFALTSELFQCYLRYVLRDPEPDFFHPLSGEWGEILRASSGTLQTQATIFCVCVEPILRNSFTDNAIALERDQAALERVQDWSQRIPNFLSEKGCPEDLQKRIEGMLSRMSGLSDRERLAWLASRGALHQLSADYYS